MSSRFHAGARFRPRATVQGGAAFVAALAATAVLGALPVVASAPSASAASAAATNAGRVTSASPPVEYAIGRPLCAPPKPGREQCFAIARERVTKGTPGARPYVVPEGGERSGTHATIGPAGGLTPYDLSQAYDVHSGAAVSDQTIAIVDAYNDPHLDGDLQTFDAHYGLATCSTADGCLRIVNEKGTTDLPPNDQSGWSVEETLDVEAAHSTCQHCKIILLEAASPSTANLDQAEDEAVTLGATEVSNSWGGPQIRIDRAMAAAFNHPGVVITASSGDDGYYDYDEFTAANDPNAPAAFNTVVAVGGTSLYLGQTARRQSETVWNDNGTGDVWEQQLSSAQGATGGGCSTVEPAPSWQLQLKDWPSTGCGRHRLVADISADADWLTGLDIYDTYDCGSACVSPGWNTIGGTSLSSPLIAAMFGLAGGAHGVAYPAKTLYGHLGTKALYDVTSGGNGFCGGEGAAACGDPNSPGLLLDCDYGESSSQPAVGDRACDALRGYDGPSGVGSPRGLGAFEPSTT